MSDLNEEILNDDDDYGDLEDADEEALLREDDETPEETSDVLEIGDDTLGENEDTGLNSLDIEEEKVERKDKFATERQRITAPSPYPEPQYQQKRPYQKRQHKYEPTQKIQQINQRLQERKGQWKNNTYNNRNQHNDTKSKNFNKVVSFLNRGLSTPMQNKTVLINPHFRGVVTVDSRNVWRNNPEPVQDQYQTSQPQFQEPCNQLQQSVQQPVPSYGQEPLPIQSQGPPGQSLQGSMGQSPFPGQMNQAHHMQGYMNQGQINQGPPMQGPGFSGPMNQGFPMQAPPGQRPPFQGQFSQSAPYQGPPMQGQMGHGPPFQGQINQGPNFQGHMNQGPPMQAHMNQGLLTQSQMHQRPPIQGQMNQAPPMQGPVTEGPPMHQINQAPPFQGQMNQATPFQGQMNQAPPFQGQMNQAPPFQGQINQGPPMQGQMNQAPFFQGPPPQGPGYPGQGMQPPGFQGPPGMQSQFQNEPPVQNNVWNCQPDTVCHNQLPFQHNQVQYQQAPPNQIGPDQMVVMQPLPPGVASNFPQQYNNFPPPQNQNFNNRNQNSHPKFGNKQNFNRQNNQTMIGNRVNINQKRKVGGGGNLSILTKKRHTNNNNNNKVVTPNIELTRKSGPVIEEDRQTVDLRVKIEENRLKRFQPPNASTTSQNVIKIEPVPTEEIDKKHLSNFLADRKIFVKDESLMNTRAVFIKNLASSTPNKKIMKICKTIGDVQKLHRDITERHATIVFKSVACAQAFFKKYQRHMLDLSMLEVTLKPMSEIEQ